jgi:signal transduction histidine kinase
VRVRTTALALCVVGAALIIAAVALVVLLHRSMVGDVDAQARMRLAAVVSLVRRSGVPPTLAGSDDDGTIAEVVVSGGRSVARSPLIQGSETLAAFTPRGDEVVVRTLKRPLAGGDAYRVAAQRIGAQRVGAQRVGAQRVGARGGTVVVYAGASLEHVTESANALRLLLAVGVPLLLLFVGFTTWTLVGRSLEPVEAIRRQVTEISVTALDRRVPEPGTADEIDRLARTMNEMLARLDAAARRQRSFVADASHELHSPLATIRARLEVALAHPDGVDWPRTAGWWLQEQARLERLIDNLLVLAQADGGVAVRSRQVVDLDELVLRELRDLRARGRVRIDVTGLAGGRVVGDPDQLRRVVRNLLDNAELHAASTVRVELARVDAGRFALAVVDDGPGIAPADRQRVFERFVRLDKARGRRAGGAGLGLAIVREIVTAHGGTAEVEDSAAGARLVVRLPAADPAEEPAAATEVAAEPVQTAVAPDHAAAEPAGPAQGTGG